MTDTPTMPTRMHGDFSLARYLRDLWHYRHLCFHLARSDLESRFRRSSLGILWVMIHPLIFASLYAVVLSTLFKQEFRDYSIYVLCGIILWDALSASVSLGAYSLVNAGGYLKQAPIPLVIFPIRTCLTIMTVFLYGVLALAIYGGALHVLFAAKFTFTVMWFWVVPIAISLFAFIIPWASIAAFANVKFRDAPQVILILTQALWFASPVFLARELFDSPFLKLWSAINPIRAFCDIFRDATIYARAPEIVDWCTIGIWIVVSWVCAAFSLMATRRTAVFYL